MVPGACYRPHTDGMSDFPPPTAEEIADLSARLDELCKASDTRSIESFLSYQDVHTKHVGNRHGRWTCQVETYLSTLAVAANRVNYLERRWPQHRGLQFVVATHSLRQIYSASGLLCRGLYDDAISLLRSVYETFLRIVFISCNQSHAYNAFYAPGQSGPRFNATNFVNDELKLEWVKYSVMSAFAHSNKFKVMEDVIALNKGEQRPITLSYKVDETLMGVGKNHFDFLTAVWLRLFSSVFRPVIPADDDGALERYRLIDEQADLAAEVLSKHTASEYWRRVAADVEKLFQLIEHMDESPNDDWKQYWASLSPDQPH